MAKFQVTLRDRQTNEKKVVWIEAKNSQEAKQIAMRDFPNYRVQLKICIRIKVFIIKSYF